jgi:uncharacterized membrane protein YhaH (DUF805 family)
MKWYFKVISQYFNFSGRARRKEFWLFMLFNLIIIWGLSVLNTEYSTIALYTYASLVFIPTVGVFLRRLHDSGKSGWNIVLIIIPFIGWIWLLILLIIVGEPRTNKWGPYPKGIEEN